MGARHADGSSGCFVRAPLFRPTDAARRLAAALGLWIVACGGSAAPPDVLLVTIDTLRADHVGAYGYRGGTSPTLDRLAAGGTLFEWAYAPTGATCPSHASLFTSRHPLAHGVVRNGLRLVAAETTLAERLRRHGWATAAFVSSYPVSRRLGFAQGFDHYDDDFSAAGPTLELEEWEGAPAPASFDRRAGATVDAALAWLGGPQAPREAPLFAWVHFFDPHHPYAPPAEFEQLVGTSGGRAAYDGEIRYADAELDRLLRGLERARSGRARIVVVTGDHGEGLRDHGWLTHNRYLYEEEVRVPLVFHAPGTVASGRRSEQPAHLVDIVPTLLSLLGLDADGARLAGRDLHAFLTADEPPEPDRDRPIWLQRPHYAEGRPELGEVGAGFGLRLRGWKWIEAPEEGRRELYDLVADPGERDNLADRLPTRARELSERLRAWRARQRRGATRAEPLRSAEDEAALRALGYAD